MMYVFIIHAENTLLQVIIERNSAQNQLENIKQLHVKEKSILQSQIDEFQKLSPASPADASASVTSPRLTGLIAEKAALKEQADSLESENKQLKGKLTETEEMIFKLSTDLQLAKSQHVREVQDWKARSLKSVEPAAYKKLEEKLMEEQKRVGELEEALSSRSSLDHKLLNSKFTVI